MVFFLAHSLPRPLSRPAGERGGLTATFGFVASASLLLTWRSVGHAQEHAGSQHYQAVASGALAEAKKPNVAVRSPSPPRWGGEGAGGCGGARTPPGWKGGRGDRGEPNQHTHNKLPGIKGSNGI